MYSNKVESMGITTSLIRVQVLCYAVRSVIEIARQVVNAANYKVLRKKHVACKELRILGNSIMCVASLCKGYF